MQLSLLQRIAAHGTDPKGWSGTLPSLFVIAALIALLLVPMAVQSRVDALRSEVEQLAEPARAMLSEVQYLLSRQSSSLQIYLASGAVEHLDSYRRFSESETEIFPELRGLAAELDPEVLAAVVELRTLSTQWHERVRQFIVDPGIGTPESAELIIEYDLYLLALDAGGRAEEALRAATLWRRAEIRGVERMARGLYILLILLALGAALAIAILNNRISRLATDAESRRGEVQWALEETARALESRSYLIRGFTHDVKNPLNAANGYAELLRSGIRGPLQPVQTETVTRIQDSIRDAVEIIDDLLELSHLESTGLRLVRDRVDLEKLLRELVRQHGASAEQAGLELVYQPGAEPGATVVFTDPGRVRQILGNLISNAVKYTPAPGRVMLSLTDESRATPPQPGRWAAIAVEDTGHGIPQEEQERIFDEFHRVPGAPGPGHGLGLSISRRIARHLGGDVTVRSTFGSGSTFFLWLPLREATAEDPGDS
jgi:signal transduction histidine kinase